MANEKGFIKLWRKIKVDDEIWDTKEPYDKRSAFIYLIMEADWKTGIIPCRLTIRYLAQIWHWHRNKVHRFIEFLKSVNKMVEVGTKNGTEVGQESGRLKICNWATYQKERVKSGTKSGTENGAILKKYKEGLRDTKVSLVGSQKTEPTGEIKSSSQYLSSDESPPKKKTDSRITELLSFWGKQFEEELGTTYVASFGRDGKLLKDLLGSVDKNFRVPKDCKLAFIGGCICFYLEEQKEKEEKYLKPDISGFYKNFNRICVEIFRQDNWDWEEVKKEYAKS